MKRIVDHVKKNLVGYLALFVALGGTSYAAVNLPAGSVGTTQLRNGAVTPAKLNGRTIGGAVRDWAYVGRDGHVLGGSRGARASVAGDEFTVNWGTRFSPNCAAMVTPAGFPGSGPLANGTGVAINESQGAHPHTNVYVWTFSGGQFAAAPFYLTVVC